MGFSVSQFKRYFHLMIGENPPNSILGKSLNGIEEFFTTKKPQKCFFPQLVHILTEHK